MDEQVYRSLFLAYDIQESAVAHLHCFRRGYDHFSRSTLIKTFSALERHPDRRVNTNRVKIGLPDMYSPKQTQWQIRRVQAKTLVKSEG